MQPLPTSFRRLRPSGNGPTLFASCTSGLDCYEIDSSFSLQYTIEMKEPVRGKGHPQCVRVGLLSRDRLFVTIRHARRHPVETCGAIYETETGRQVFSLTVKEFTGMNFGLATIPSSEDCASYGCPRDDDVIGSARFMTAGGIFAADTGRRLCDLDDPPSSTWCALYCPEDPFNIYLAGTAGSGIRVYDPIKAIGPVQKGRTSGDIVPQVESKLAFQGHTSTVFGLDYDVEFRSLVSCASDSTARVWDSRQGPLEVSMSKLSAGAYSVILAPDRHLMLIGTNRGGIEVFDRRNLQTCLENFIAGRSFLRSACRVDRERFAFGDQSGNDEGVLIVTAEGKVLSKLPSKGVFGVCTHGTALDRPLPYGRVDDDSDAATERLGYLTGRIEESAGVGVILLASKGGSLSALRCFVVL